MQSRSLRKSFNITHPHRLKWDILSEWIFTSLNGQTNLVRRFQQVVPVLFQCNHCPMRRKGLDMYSKRLITVIGMIFIPTVFSTSIAVGADDLTTLDAQIVAPTTISVQYVPVEQKSATAGISSLSTAISPCVLNLQNIYLRQSFGYGAVGTKATTTCSVKVTSISHYTYIQKLGFWGWNTEGFFPASNSNSSSLTQLDVGVTCTNGISTTWTGYTNGYVMYNGVQYTASVTVANAYGVFNCGT